mmetsp:Transcript_93249/g.241007  ORF Transcript_93249/g.241007 Transcript_93249/m.241007 type:complete len:616 (+) Transcript_93249:97-1944(+)
MSPNPETRSKRAVRSRARDILQAARLYRSGDLEAFYQTLTCSTFRNSQVSVTLASPSLPDCPIVGVSDGFEQMTGWSRSEVIGRNARFLNRGCPMPAETRHELRLATRTRSRRFVKVLVNRRRNGETFMNLLHLSALRVSNCLYLLAVQADVTHSDVDLRAEEQLEELERIVSRIFASSVDVWAAQQASSFRNAESAFSYAEMRLCNRYTAQQWQEARNIFVMLLPSEAGDCAKLSYTNTFIEVCSDTGPGNLLTRLRHVFSEPDLSIMDDEDQVRDQAEVIPVSTLREVLKHLPPDGRVPWPQLMEEEASQNSWAAEAPVKEATEVLGATVEIGEEGDDGSCILKSAGSSLHPGQCKPCSFFCYSFSGCSKGKECTYCHMSHPRRRSRRGKKKPKSASSSSAGSSGTSQGSGNSCCADPAQVSLNPTKAMLVPLLDALKVLAPLPYIPKPSMPPSGGLGESPALKDSAAWITSPEKKVIGNGAPEQGDMDDEDEQIRLSYTESTVVLVLGQIKQIMPFVSGLSRPMVFGVNPPLPNGLGLHTNSGVISGIVAQTTPSNGEAHTVTVTGRAGSASTVLHVIVLESYSDGDSACGSEQLNVTVGDDFAAGDRTASD